MYHPLQLLTNFFTTLFTATLIFLNVYLLREWYYHKDIWQDENYAKWCLALGILSLIVTFFGGPLIGFILGKNIKNEPDMVRSEETQTLELPDGQEIFLEFYGPSNKPPIIFIHGWSSNSLQWYYFKQNLATDYRLIMMDLPGLGNSGKKPNKDYSPSSFATDLDFVIDKVCTQKPIIIGHSIGGMTILSYCKMLGHQLQDKVAGLVLVQTSYTNPIKTCILSGLFTFLQNPLLKPLCYLMIALAPLFQIMNGLQFANGSAHIGTRLTGFAGTQSKGQLNVMSFLMMTASVDVVARGMLGMFSYDATKALSQINVPVLILAGDKDILCKPEASEFMSAAIPNSQLTVLAPSGHMGVLERNTEMVASVAEFAEFIAK